MKLRIFVLEQDGESAEVYSELPDACEAGEEGGDESTEITEFETGLGSRWWPTRVFHLVGPKEWKRVEFNNEPIGPGVRRRTT